ncbi:zinc finger E-box-binding homeobox 1 [Astyanax mexicanus]|uniref:zinc finger E-box-binding homeobox 1 n=1 Tax=Astyanax mexicanus TaxID=7994 RepID=UPI0020CB5071|nr:zinc finger E-box-binding homeobox 1 [Astyanax mexicanus]XP_007256531.3 zinc finger E-box-binding homeobox 1 [Astyanax mexicanus]
MECEPEDQILQTVPSISGVSQEQDEGSPDGRDGYSKKSPKPDSDPVSGSAVQSGRAVMNGATSPTTKTDTVPIDSQLEPNCMSEDSLAEMKEPVTKANNSNSNLSSSKVPEIQVQRQSPPPRTSSTSSKEYDEGSSSITKEEVQIQDCAQGVDSADEYSATHGKSKNEDAEELEIKRHCITERPEFSQADCNPQILLYERQQGFDLAMQNDALTHSTSVPVQEELCEALDLSLPKKTGRDKEKCKWVLDSGYEGSLLMEVDEIEDDTPLIEVEQDEDEEEECWIEDANRSFHLGEDWDQHSVSHIAIPSPPAGTCFSPLDPNDTLLIDDQGIPYTLTSDGQKVPQIDPSEMPKDVLRSPIFAQFAQLEDESIGLHQDADPSQETPLLNLSLRESSPVLSVETSLEPSNEKLEKASSAAYTTAETTSTAVPVISNLPSLPIQIVASNTGSNTPILLLPQSQLQTLSASAANANPGVMTLSLPLALAQNAQSSSSSVFLVLSSPQVSQISATSSVALSSASGSLSLKPEPVSCTTAINLSGQNKPCNCSPAPTSPIPSAPSSTASLTSKSLTKQVKTEPCTDSPTSFQEALVRLAVSAIQKAESQPKSVGTPSVVTTSTNDEVTEAGSPSATNVAEAEHVLLPVSEPTSSTPVDQTESLRSPTSGDDLPPPSSASPLRPPSPIFPTNHPKNQDPQGLGQRRILYCQYCPRVFYYLSDLERHSITHSQNKPHVCQLCGKAFKRSSHLERHKHIHTGQRNFVCQLCPRRFREAAELTRHQRVHTGEKPFQCLLCHMRFAERNTLRRHTKRKHQGQQQEAMNMKVKLETEGVSALGVQGQQEENAEWYSSTMTEMDSDNDTGGE